MGRERGPSQWPRSASGGARMMRRRPEPRIAHGLTDAAQHPRECVGLTVAAEFLGCHRVTLHKLLRARALRYRWVGQRRAIAVADLIQYRAATTVDAAPRVARETRIVLSRRA